MSLYGYILSIEIIIVICVLFVHTSIVTTDEFDITHGSHNLQVSYIDDEGLICFRTESTQFVHSNVSFGIGHNVESFLDFFFLVIPTAIIIYILIPSLGLLYNKEFLLDYATYSFVIDVVGHQWY